MEQLPCADEVLYDVDVRACLYVEVAGIEESADVEAGNEFKGLVLRVGRRALAVQVEVVALGSLEIALFEGFPVPGAIALSDIHVVHVDRHPYVGGGIGDAVVDVFVDEEVVGACRSILDEVDTRLAHGGEVELDVIVFEVGTPGGELRAVDLGGRSVGVEAHKRGCGLGRVVLV